LHDAIFGFAWIRHASLIDRPTAAMVVSNRHPSCRSILRLDCVRNFGRSLARQGRKAVAKPELADKLQPIRLILSHPSALPLVSSCTRMELITARRQLKRMMIAVGLSLPNEVREPQFSGFVGSFSRGSQLAPSPLCFDRHKQ